MVSFLRTRTAINGLALIVGLVLLVFGTSANGSLTVGNEARVLAVLGKAEAFALIHEAGLEAEDATRLYLLDLRDGVALARNGRSRGRP